MEQIQIQETESDQLIEHNVEMKIAQETYEEVKQIEEDTGLIPELLHSIKHLVWNQGFNLNVAYENIEDVTQKTTEAVTHLESAEKYADHTHKIRDATIVASGTAIGSIGWIGGPWFGIPGTGLGLGISSGIVFIMRKVGV